MTDSLILLLMVASFLSLIGLGFSGVMVSQAYARRQKRDQRILEVVAPFRQIRAELQIFRPIATHDKSLMELAAGVFGFHPARQDQYPVKWWLVLAVTFVLARVAAGFLVDVVGSLGLGAMPVLWVGMCRWFFGSAIRRRRDALVSQFPDALAMIVRSVRVGIPVLGALTTVAQEAQAPTSLEFARLANDLFVGVPLDEAAINMAQRNDLAEYRFFATAIGLQAQTGGALSETLENLGELIRKRLALRERAHALSSEARTSSMILGGLPVVMGAGLWLLNPGYISVLFTTSMGRSLLGAAALSLTCGALVMRAIIRKSLS